MRRAALALATVLVMGSGAAATATAAAADAGSGAAPVETVPVQFAVTNPMQPGSMLNVAGTLFRSPARSCASSVMLLVHGLSYGRFAWDFPIDPDRYSVARALARAGYPAVAIDLPGYGASTKPNGQTLTVEGYADMVGQIDRQLRAGSYGGPAFAHVGLLGHSAGSEISELAAAQSPFDVLIPTGYTHVPSARVVQDFFTGDYVRAATSDYEYFGGTPQGRLEYMYNAPYADPAVMAEDNRLANLTPSGEIYSIGPQPSKLVMGLIRSPVLLVIGEADALFPSQFAPQDLALFVGAPDKQLYVVPSSGHSFMLHRSAPQTVAVIADWLGKHADALPACPAAVPAAAAAPSPAPAAGQSTAVLGARQTRGSGLAATGSPTGLFAAGLLVLALAIVGRWIQTGPP
jgi:pimeloyl-ACP methyl ester carboxylesterase